MVRIWPWTKFAQLERIISNNKERENYHLFRIEVSRNTALQAMRDLAAANKGIRRLKAKLKQYEQN